MSESVKDFLARGGKITKIESVESKEISNSRYRERDLTVHDHQNMTRVRVDNYKRKSGGKLPPDQKMYLKFCKRFGL